MKRFLSALVVVSVLLVAQPQAAHANSVTDTATCRSAPDPQAPTTGMAAMFVPMPDKPVTADPWQPDGTRNQDVSIADVYGFAGLEWVTYDQGCTGQMQAYAPNQIERFGLSMPVAVTALARGLTDALKDPHNLQVFDPIITDVAAKLQDSAGKLLPISLGLVALFVMVQAWRRNLGRALDAAVWAVLLLGVGVWFAHEPLTAVHWYDDQVTEVSSAATSAFGGTDKAVDQVHEQVLFNTWLAGTFGDANTPSAKKYGPELFKAGTYSWSDIQYMRDHPDEAGKLKDDKRQHWADIADEIQHNDPVAYEHLQGKHIPDHRWGRILMEDVAVVGALGYQILSSLLMLLARLAGRMLVMCMPLIIVVAVFPSKRSVLLRLVEGVVGYAAAAIIVQVAAGVVGLLVGTILATAGIAAWFATLMILVVFFAAWVLIKPWRRPFGGKLGRAGKGAALLALWGGSSYAGSKKGVEAAARNQQQLPAAAPAPTPAGGGEPRHHYAGHARPRAESWEPRVRPVAELPAVTGTARTVPKRQDAPYAPTVRQRDSASSRPIIDMTPRKGKDGRVVYEPV